MSQKDICLIETSAGYQINVDRIATISPYKGGTRIVELINGQRHTYIVRETFAQIAVAIRRATAHRVN